MSPTSRFYQVTTKLTRLNSTSSVESKLSIYIRIVRNFLEDEDSTSADTYFSRASLLYHHTSDLATQLQYKGCQARMFDYSRRFAEAASKYHDLSYVSDIPEEDRLASLCARFHSHTPHTFEN